MRQPQITMKTTIPSLVLTATAVCASAAFAASTPTDATKATVPHQPARAAATAGKKPAGQPAELITGSHLPQKVVMVGSIPVTAHPVRIITRDQIDTTGATDLAAALRRTVPGMH